MQSVLINLFMIDTVSQIDSNNLPTTKLNQHDLVYPFLL